MRQLSKRVAALVLLLTLAACHGYKVHPGALNTFDSKTYDTLLTTQTGIETAQAQIKSGALPERFKPTVNKMAALYTSAYNVYLKWNDAAGKGAPSDKLLVELKAALAALEAANAEFKRAK